MASDSLLPPYPSGMEQYPLLHRTLTEMFTIKNLKAVLRDIGAPLTGNKPYLMQRAVKYLDDSVRHSRGNDYDRIRRSIEGETSAQFGGISQPHTFGDASQSIHLENGSPFTTQHPHLQQRPQPPPTGRYSSSSHARPLQTNGPTQVQFRQSPFIETLSACFNPVTFAAVPHTRHVSSTSFRLSDSMLAKLRPREQSNRHRLCLFCATAPSAHLGHALVEFPTHVDVRINGQHLTANLRGIKNRPGTVNPPDITSYLILEKHVYNRIEIFYAQTIKSFLWVAKLAVLKSAEDLFNEISGERRLSKESVEKKMKEEAEDADLVATCSELSLKDPLSYVRIETPCRSVYCQHLQCFDLKSFLQLNEQTPTWQCPHCNRSMNGVTELAVDEYFNDILQCTDRSVTSVVVYPGGKWAKKDIEADSDSESDSDSDNKRLTTTSHSPSTSRVVDLSEAAQAASNNSGASPAAPSSVSQNSRRRTTNIVDLTLDSDDESQTLQPNHISHPQTDPLQRILVTTGRQLSSHDLPNKGLELRPLFSPIPQAMHGAPLPTPAETEPVRRQSSGSTDGYSLSPPNANVGGTNHVASLRSLERVYERPSIESADTPIYTSNGLSPATSPPIGPGFRHPPKRAVPPDLLETDDYQSESRRGWPSSYAEYRKDRYDLGNGQ